MAAVPAVQSQSAPTRPGRAEASLLEAVADAACVSDPEGRITAWNERFPRMWRLGPGALEHDDPGAFRAAAGRFLHDPDRHFARVDETHRENPPETHDLIELLDGRVYERLSRARTLEGRALGRVWTFRDITGHRRAQEALLRNEAELRALADSMSQLAWMAEPDGHIFWYNRRWFDYTGTTLEQMRGWGWRFVHDPALVEEVTVRWRHALERGVPFEMEFPLRRADGVYRWFLNRAAPVRDGAGRVTRWFGTNTDIDDAKRAEWRLRESEARLRVALETAQLGAWELDARCLALFAPRARPTMGLEDFGALAAADWRETRIASLRRLRAGEMERYDLEFRVEGVERWLQSGAKPVRDAPGAVTWVIGGVLDITDLVRARASTEERQRELERMVAERTASLHQAVAQMEEFSYSVSHDLRAPLRAIQGYAQAVLEDCAEQLGPRSREQLARIVAAGRRLDRLTLDVLTYSRLARGGVTLAPVALERLVDEVVEQYAAAEARRGELRVERPLLAVLGHEPLLAQALSNLLANALKFTAPGARPEVRLGTEAVGPGRVRLWVEDKGIGVRPEHRARIWGMFERVYPEERYEGTGIGLAIVRKAAERMGGAVGVESEPGRGSRFWIELEGAG